MWLIQIVVVVLYILGMACQLSKSVLSRERFQRKTEKWNEGDNRLIESVRNDTYQKVQSTRGTHHNTFSRNVPVPEGKEHVRTYDKAFLFIGAPLEDELQSGIGPLKLSENAAKEQLISEYRNYCKLNPELKTFDFPPSHEFDSATETHFAKKFDMNETRYFLQLSSVDSYEKMMTIVKDFMKKNGSQAAVAYVYFNGHGAELENMKSQLVFKQPMKSNQTLETVQTRYERYPRQE